MSLPPSGRGRPRRVAPGTGEWGGGTPPLSPGMGRLAGKGGGQHIPPPPRGRRQYRPPRPCTKARTRPRRRRKEAEGRLARGWGCRGLFASTELGGPFVQSVDHCFGFHVSSESIAGGLGARGEAHGALCRPARRAPPDSCAANRKSDWGSTSTGSMVPRLIRTNSPPSRPTPQTPKPSERERQRSEPIARRAPSSRPTLYPLNPGPGAPFSLMGGAGTGKGPSAGRAQRREGGGGGERERGRGREREREREKECKTQEGERKTREREREREKARDREPLGPGQEVGEPAGDDARDGGCRLQRPSESLSLSPFLSFTLSLYIYQRTCERNF